MQSSVYTVVYIINNNGMFMGVYSSLKKPPLISISSVFFVARAEFKLKNPYNSFRRRFYKNLYRFVHILTNAPFLQVRQVEHLTFF